MKIELIIFCSLIGITALFQLALALGAPWGKIAMGGKFPGKFPRKLRIAAIFQMCLLLFFAWIAIVKSGQSNPEWKPFADTMIWVVVGFSAIATILNIITPSKWERLIWGPVAIILLVTNLIIALY